jgi:hypothetical protein
LEDVRVEFGGQTSTNVSVCGKQSIPSDMSSAKIFIEAPLVSFYFRWSAAAKELTSLKAYTNTCAINSYSAYDLVSFEKPIIIQLSDRNNLDPSGAYFADFPVPTKPSWVVEKEYQNFLALSSYTCDYSLFSIVTGEIPSYLRIQTSQGKPYVRFSKIKSQWPIDVLHDKIELLCEVAGADFTVKSTFEVLFYEFKYEDADQLPEDEKCFHVASKVPENPAEPPYIN